VLALGASFSALEVVPLVLIGFEAYENYKHSQRSRGWPRTLADPVFVAVAFWNMVGAACSASSSTRRSRLLMQA